MIMVIYGSVVMQCAQSLDDQIHDLNVAAQTSDHQNARLFL